MQLACHVAGARDDSEDEDFLLGQKARQPHPRKRARASPPPPSDSQPWQQQQQQQQQQSLEAAAGEEEEVAAGGANGSKYVGVQRIASSKHASKQWIPRPTGVQASKVDGHAAAAGLSQWHAHRCHHAKHGMLLCTMCLQQ